MNLERLLYQGESEELAEWGAPFKVIDGEVMLKVGEGSRWVFLPIGYWVIRFENGTYEIASPPIMELIESHNHSPTFSAGQGVMILGLGVGVRNDQVERVTMKRYPRGGEGSATYLRGFIHTKDGRQISSEIVQVNSQGYIVK